MREVLGDHGVRVEKEDILTLRKSQCLVIRLCKSDILVIDQEPYGGEQRPQRLGATIGRMVVDDDDLRFESRQCFLQRVQTQLQEVSHPVVDYNDGEDHTTK